MLQYLPDAERARFRTLQQLAAEIRQNYQGVSASSQPLLDDLAAKLDFLLSFYLRMRSSLVKYRTYFSTTDPDRIKRRLDSLGEEIERAPERVKPIKARTKAVLEKRLERYQRAFENQQLVEAQTETVVEVLQLLRDQSYALSDPKSIAEQLDSLVHSAEETEKGVRDLEELLRLDDDLMSSSEGMDAETLEALGGALSKLPGSTLSSQNNRRQRTR